jgi:hypothetical protein
MITASSASGTAMKSRTSGSNIPDYVTRAAPPHPPVPRRRSPRLGAERGLRAVDPHGREPVQPDGLDQRSDVRLGAAQPQHAPLRAQALGEAREVDHQRRVGEVQLREVDDHVARGLQRGGQGTTPASTGRAVFVPRDPEDRQLLVEVNDAGTLIHTGGFVQGVDK